MGNGTCAKPLTLGTPGRPGLACPPSSPPPNNARSHSQVHIAHDESLTFPRGVAHQKAVKTRACVAVAGEEMRWLVITGAGTMRVNLYGHPP